MPYPILSHPTLPHLTLPLFLAHPNLVLPRPTFTPTSPLPYPPLPYFPTFSIWRGAGFAAVFFSFLFSFFPPLYYSRSGRQGGEAMSDVGGNFFFSQAVPFPRVHGHHAQFEEVDRQAPSRARQGRRRERERERERESQVGKCTQRRERPRTSTHPPAQHTKFASTTGFLMKLASGLGSLSDRYDRF
ncbi:hypothetical protein GGS23DRAFT_514207 [Durotheca rogersii]|uniref:uncharacterized protein n=1 Tax=Durotheca rogersii TaxID=419775 RepID=UPI00221E7A37|nr:uncharacterized protein GGS23DRAFT_514207 [Durotheca rogersii]KAI5863794.1 hypothetical protein GGS23DRAFT_514207 [Durotheca rogersii]